MARRPRRKAGSKARTKTLEVDVLGAFGAAPTYDQRFSVYVANRDKNGQPVNRDTWVKQAMELLADINGGASALPAMSGLWRNPATGQDVEEETVVVYSIIRPEAFAARLEEVVEFVKRYGREASQGEVFMEFGGDFFSITDYD